MDDELFGQYVEQAVASLPVSIREKMENVAILVEDFPEQDQLTKSGVHSGGLLLGLYQGIPRTNRGSGYGIGGTLPDKITIFKNSILAVSTKQAEIIEQIRSTVLHEIAHHFGMDEKAVRKAENRRIR